MNQKGFANIVLIVVIIAIVAVGGYFVFSKKSNQFSKSPIPTSTQNFGPIADWETYTLPTTDEFLSPAPALGFSFRYPSIFRAPILSFNRVTPGDSPRRQINISTGSGSFLVDITVNARSYGGTIVPELKNTSSGTVVSGDNRTLTYQTGRFTPLGGPVRMWYVGTRVNEDAYFMINGDVYSIRFSANDDSDQTQLVRQILSTIKFTN
ncbi:MAG: hypothetical protein A3J07_00955 [Candidatus Doudnabacteria bacterium RIFCSPLOWO2_02_FULL_49_13]|uniref:Uncharacterized protein n=1 Tax=Candidatus Doudnabacteria bacterium RIFCSPHIGHO2_12_FULL_48_16 TaxID=1817838 RepID=A0A1F5PKB8_9BACT|nr:MAG: hypothetical protein A2760_04415 [Candidatus Doudnabacteria bacterium RIFCSPHIGHO2_01_FULL_50_67]OGE90317.1 MAG: hypothetical protein A3E29_04465 [Candidatus Doudnabacteria bacterium RIFCSPHIGHO2_12_FULL_48_16]OGF02373.1 MAG: hypothetical protein A3J07_00955 [Candidatus Doudnabacteria bacterium RIFCSPLOWO2_02_FULL_49_13]OGF03427.1 MAG: hypothetical protein A3H14_01365 [Candidatus Doudnabacteria bacterium RIFCSPLOWO2_12_FULL_49_8]